VFLKKIKIYDIIKQIGKNMKKVLIVGGCGYIGGYMTDLLIASKRYDVTVYDNMLYEERFLKNVSFIKGDVRDKQKLLFVLPDYDIVIWLAAIVGDGACAVDPSYTEEINTNAVKFLVDNYKGKIVFTSTCSIYGINNDLIDENAIPNPLSVYAATKLEAEKYILANTTNSLVFRLGTLFGLGDEHSRIRLDLVANILTKRAVRGESLKVFGGEQWRPLLHVKDVSTAVLYGLENNITGLYNLAYDNYTMKQLADQIGDTLENVKIEYVDMKFEDQRNYRVKNQKYLNTGWKSKYSLYDGIMELKKVFTENRIKDINDPVYSNEAFMKILLGDKK
jgi:nucleoside-diphosphate-sugar epimerase